jgi:hypothetical protein
MMPRSSLGSFYAGGQVARVRGTPQTFGHG